MTKIPIKNKYPQYDKQIICKYNGCENKITHGDWMCDKHKDTEYIWENKCLNCGHYH